MNVTKEELGKCEVLLTVEIDNKQKKRLLEKAARRISRQMRIPGFRPGKAPYRIIVNKFGEEAIQEEAMSELTEDIFRKALDEAELTPYEQASLDSLDWDPLIMKVKVPTQPVVELGSYRDIRIEFEAPEVSDEELAEELDRLLEQHTTLTEVDRAAQIGDVVTLTISEKSTESDEFLEEEHQINVTLEEAEEGEADDGPDISTNIVGLAAGAETSWLYTYPDDYTDEDFAGKEVEISATVKVVKEKEVLELDDDFAALVGDYDSLDQLKEQVTKDLAQRKQYQVDQELMPKVLEQVVAESDSIEWPAALEEKEIEHALHHREQELSQQGLNLETYLQMQQQTEEELKEELREDVQENVRNSLVLSKIVELEDLQIDTQELRQQAELMTMLSGGTPQAQQAFQSPAGLQMLANNMLTERARRRLLAIAKGEVEAEEAAAAEAAALAAAAAEKAAEAAEGQDDDSTDNAPVAAEVVAEQTDSNTNETAEEVDDDDDDATAEEVTEEGVA